MSNSKSAFIPCNSPDIVFSKDSSWTSPSSFNTTGENNQQITFGNGNPSSSRNTSVIGSVIVYPFEGTQITVFGVSRPGQDNVSATYQIDGGEPTSQSLNPNNQSSPTANYQYYTSDNLSSGRHIILINVTKTGITRPYEFESFQITNDPSKSNGGSNNNNNNNGGGNGGGQSKAKSDSQTSPTKTIVGSVLGALFGIILLLLVLFLIWRRRLSKQMSYRDSRRLRPMICYTGPSKVNTAGYKESRPYYVESYTDKDSRFMSDEMLHGYTQPTRLRSRETSWVSPSLPPSVPQSVFVNSRLSEWSSYRGSEGYEEKEPQNSYFSPITTASLSTMAFKEPPPPTSKKPSQADTLTISTVSGSSKRGRAF